jgi:hypothetical protein
MSLGGGKRIALAAAVALFVTRCDLNPRPEDPGNDLTATPGGSRNTHGSADSGASMPPDFGGPGNLGHPTPRDGGEPDSADAAPANHEGGVDAAAPDAR